MNNKVLKRAKTTSVCRPCRSRMNNLCQSQGNGYIYEQRHEKEVTELGRIQTVRANG